MTRELTPEQAKFEEEMGIQIAWPEEVDLTNPTLFIPLSDDDLMDLVHDIMQNFPEYLPHYFQCTSFKYAPDWIVEFIDVEDDDREYRVDDSVMLKGLKQYITEGYKEAKDKFKWLTWAMDPCNHDALETFRILNFGLFGEQVYCYE